MAMKLTLEEFKTYQGNPGTGQSFKDDQVLKSIGMAQVMVYKYMNLSDSDSIPNDESIKYCIYLLASGLLNENPSNDYIKNYSVPGILRVEHASHEDGGNRRFDAIWKQVILILHNFIEQTDWIRQPGETT